MREGVLVAVCPDAAEPGFTGIAWGCWGCWGTGALGAGAGGGTDGGLGGWDVAVVVVDELGRVELLGGLHGFGLFDTMVVVDGLELESAEDAVEGAWDGAIVEMRGGVGVLDGTRRAKGL